MTIKKAVITAAARGQKLYPVADTVQKAMLPIIDPDGINKPIIQVIAEEAIYSGIEEICIICAPGDDKRYVESFNVLRSTIQAIYKNSSWAEKQVWDIKNFLERVSFSVQDEPRGYGDAVYQAKSFVNGEAFLLLSGDYLYISNVHGKRCARQLIDLAVKEDCTVSAVNPTIEHQISKYGTLTGKTYLNNSGIYTVERIIEKPSVSQAEIELQTTGLRAGYYLCFFGMHVFKPIIFDLLEEEIVKSNGKNILLTPVQEKLAQTEKYLAMIINGNRYDTSKKLGLLKAQIALGLAGSERDEILSSIIQIMAEAGKVN